MDEKRQKLRMRRLKEGRIVFNDRKSLMSVRVRDIGPSGARLVCGEPYLAPINFEVAVVGEPGLRAAERVWIKGNEMGVKFMG